MTTRLVPCPRCRRCWPVEDARTPHADADVDWTCPLCLHAEVARLKRQVAALAGVASYEDVPR